HCGSQQGRFGRQEVSREVSRDGSICLALLCKTVEPSLWLPRMTKEPSLWLLALHDGVLALRAHVTNTGKRAGREVVQFYCSAPDGRQVLYHGTLRRSSLICRGDLQRCAIHILQVIARCVGVPIE
ncbi:MAG: hypothetical protein IJT34_07320, partial [Butyrivibrio sp.]|nr:hypothetical protein [Butyrivibrio sp.]